MLRLYAAALTLLVAAPLAHADASLGPTSPGIDRATFARRYVRACDAFSPRDPCDLFGDLDGDGRDEKITKIRARAGAHAAGLAVFWSTGRITLLGASLDQRGRRLDDEGQATVATMERDLTDVVRWSIDRATLVPYPGRTRDAILLVGGDAAERFFIADGSWVVSPLGY